MSKETSTVIKGIAILMMLWYHLFGISELEDLCTPLLYINGKALVAYIAQASYPVTFFLILSGYGLTYIYKQQRLNVKSQAKRLMKLFIHYWLVLLIFVTIGHFINPAVYPQNILHVIANIIGIRCTYNGETWFLLPYAIVSLSSYWIIMYVYHLNSKKGIALTLFFYAIVFLFARHLGNNLPNDPVWETLLIQPVYFVQLTFYFSLGIILYRCLEKEPIFKYENPYIYMLLLVCTIVVKSMFKITIADGLYAFAFIWCFIHLSLNKYIRKILYELGHRSMVMWMTHTFFSVYLFQDFIYGFKYPLLIFLMLVIITFVTAIPIMYISGKILKLIKI